MMIKIASGIGSMGLGAILWAIAAFEIALNLPYSVNVCNHSTLRHSGLAYPAVFLMSIFVSMGDAIQLSSDAKKRRKWRDTEVFDSIKRNVIDCKVEYFIVRGDPSVAPKGVKIHLLNPSRAEEAFFDELPTSLTQANRNISHHAAISKYTMDLWGSRSNIRWAIPMDHPGQNRKLCINMTLLASTGNVVDFYHGYRQHQRGFYVMNAVHGFIHPSGATILPCGSVIGDEGCETRKVLYSRRWIEKCRQSIQQNKAGWESLFHINNSAPDLQALTNGCADLSMLGSPDGKTFAVRRYEKVFTIAALWDYNYHHFLVESLARLVHSLPFLRRHQDVHIHIREFEEYDNNYKTQRFFAQAAKEMRWQLFRLLGISPGRIISGPVLADIVFIPRYTRCSYVLSNSHQMLALGKELIGASYRELIGHRDSLALQFALVPSVEALKAEHRSLKNSWKSMSERMKPVSNDRLVIIQQRANVTSSSRYWSNETASFVHQAFARFFPTHKVLLFASSVGQSRTMAEEFYLYSKADVLVGLHGAGLTNMLVMRPNSLVVEMVGAFVDVNMPVCGYYGPLAAAVGHHHLLHSYDWREEGVPAEAVAQRAAALFHSTRKVDLSDVQSITKAYPRIYP